MENAILHGISKRASGGTVIVSAKQVGDRLDIRVLDDGRMPLTVFSAAPLGKGRPCRCHGKPYTAGLLKRPTEVFYRAALNELAGGLDPVRFVRIHRSAIVNVESILRLEPISHGEFEVILKDGSRSKISRTYRSQLEKRLGQSL